MTNYFSNSPMNHSNEWYAGYDAFEAGDAYNEQETTQWRMGWVSAKAASIAA